MLRDAYQVRLEMVMMESQTQIVRRRDRNRDWNPRNLRLRYFALSRREKYFSQNIYALSNVHF